MTNHSIPSPATDKPRLGPILLGLISAAMPCCLFGYHFVNWSLEQAAQASLSIKQVAWASRLSLAGQAIALVSVLLPLLILSKEPTLKKAFRSLLIAALIAIPSTLFRFLPPHADQLGALAQIALALIVSIVGLIWWSADRRGENRFGLTAAFVIAAFAAGPFAVYGALGSPTDALLALAVGVALSLLINSLMVETGNGILNALFAVAIGALVVSAFGYDGSQLPLLALLSLYSIAAPLFSFRGGVALLALVIAAPLAFFDSTEFSILLGGQDISRWAIRAVLISLGVGLVAIIALQVARLIKRTLPAVLPVAMAVAVWAGAIGLYFGFGQPGYYGERLFVLMKDQADLSAATAIPDRVERLTFVFDTLTSHANTTQADLRAMLDRLGVGYRPFYLMNAIEVRGGALMHLYLMSRSDVDRVIVSQQLRPLPAPYEVEQGTLSSPPEGVQWNVKMIGADRVWSEFGATGRGIVIGQSDSGVDVFHAALRDSYRGAHEGDDYNWLDPWYGTSSPVDDGGHGTHTLGSILGSGGIGIAPDATWFACANLRRNLGNPATYLDCMQFMLAPYPHGGDPFSDGDPTRAAHILNNSWGCPPLEGCDPNALEPAASALRAAGIFVVVSAGNDGPNCETVASPLALYDAVFSVGAVDRHGNVADFSSRGPVTADDSNRPKPEIIAPGVDVLSALPGNTYGEFSGTSMAGPHVAGAVALLWSAQPALIGNIDATEQLLIETASPYRGSWQTGCFDGVDPNYAYGYGILNIFEAVKLALQK